MCFFWKNKTNSAFNVSDWTDRLVGLKSNLEVKLKTLEINADEQSEMGSIRKEALDAARKCTQLLEKCMASISEMLPPRDGRRRSEFSEKINEAISVICDAQASITTPYDYKARLLPAVDNLYNVIAECVKI